MKKNDLIKKLQEIEGNPEVAIFDWRKNLHNADDEGSSEGIEIDYNVALETESINKPFVSLSFKNDDYKEDGTPDYGASILNCE